MLLNSDIRAANVLRHVKMHHLLSRLGHPLSHGESTQQIRCPVHEDRRPSARLYTDTQLIHCYTCQKTWNVVALAMVKQALSRDAAIAWLEREFAVPSPTEDLVGTLRTVLAKPRPSTDLNSLVNLVETRLIECRDKLGPDRSFNLFVALDTMSYQVRKGQMSTEAVSSYLTQILRACDAV